MGEHDSPFTVSPAAGSVLVAGVHGGLPLSSAVRLASPAKYGSDLEAAPPARRSLAS
jgi:hypothetical protein